jgi:acetyl esterase
VLRDEGEAYAARLQQQGVPTRLIRYDGMIHGCAGMLVVDGARQMLQELAQGLKAGLA